MLEGQIDWTGVAASDKKGVLGREVDFAAITPEQFKFVYEDIAFDKMEPADPAMARSLDRSRAQHGPYSPGHAREPASRALAGTRKTKPRLAGEEVRRHAVEPSADRLRYPGTRLCGWRGSVATSSRPVCAKKNGLTPTESFSR